VATIDPYQNWSGAPKHWVNVPAQRIRPPTPAQLDAAPRPWGASEDTTLRAEWSVAAVALTVAVAAFVLIGIAGAVTAETPPPDRTTGTSVR
jgi:hypothetical protein